ncbi:hypothetical protein ABOM_007866 [Aspergillus bombycis]|uniref:DUF7726 domain-containing protein n=1 Tax=Aspergillus bombycis TaxID=109264 RepID=A0A1F7ZSB8_9EURO|nr:hypothetical protein ABOM_007866 [Aspergillus bombycis]OGM42360.1 hypothetical protein ABOM_007866 [Aspergillus bombycis]
MFRPWITLPRLPLHFLAKGYPSAVRNHASCRQKASAKTPRNAADPNGRVVVPQPPSGTSHMPDMPDMRPGDENTDTVILSPGKSTQPMVSTAGTKRKADASEHKEIEIDDEDPRLDVMKWDCNQIRRKIKNFIESKEMKIGEFQDTIRVSSRSYNAFLNLSGKMRGSESNTYAYAHRFFAKRELQGIKERKNKRISKQAKLDSEKRYDVSGIHLPGEEECKVMVFDTCDEVRKKIRAYLRNPNVTKAGFLREIVKAYPPEQDVKLQGNSLTRFLNMAGPNAGNTNAVFYAAYVFFEKLRIRDDRPKTKFREEMEKIWGRQGGFDTTTARHRGVWCHESEFEYVDKYGRGFGRRK